VIPLSPAGNPAWDVTMIELFPGGGNNSALGGFFPGSGAEDSRKSWNSKSIPGLEEFLISDIPDSRLGTEITDWHFNCDVPKTYWWKKISGRWPLRSISISLSTLDQMLLMQIFRASD
jgi:hypothetical protein